MALTTDYRVPNLASAPEAQLEQMVSNWYGILCAALAGARLHAGWQTVMTSSSSPLDYSQPDYMTLSYTYTDVSPNVTVQIKYNYTWTAGKVSALVIQFDDGTGGGFVTITGGTFAITRDGSGNFISASSS